MWNGKIIKKYILLFAASIFAQCANAQTNDSLQKKDTLAVYKKIKKIAYKYKATILLFHAIFVDPSPPTYEVKPLSDNQKKEDPNLKFSGKIIRKVNIQVYDPFGYSVNDTTKREVNPLQKLGNRYHITTRHGIIRNLLLFKPGDTLELIKINESERLIRASPYVNDARIYVENDSTENSDSIDVTVIVQDKSKLDASGSGSTTGGKITLRDRNIMGTGQQYQQSISYNINGNYEFAGRYLIANISKSYISSNIFYTTGKDLLQTGISFDRGFYSASAKWAGGISAVQTWTTYNYTDALEHTEKKIPLNYFNSDEWIARSITLKGSNENFNNIIIAFRHAQTCFRERPSLLLDTGMLYSNTTLYLGSAGFSLSKYYKDQYIFRFGANEDIPEGLVAQVLFGLVYKENAGTKYYAGFEVSRGKHFERIGYFSAAVSYGTFFNKEEKNNSTLRLGLNYFTDLLRSKRWYYRQFIYLKYITGFNKPVNEKITLLPHELYGFSNGTLTGNSKLLLNLEGVTYAPYNLIGFRFAPLALMGFGILRPGNEKLLQSRIYHAYAIGLLIRNESLLNSSFKITFGFYPYLPDDNTHWFKFNPVTSFTIKLTGFSISKPSVISYD